MGAHDKAAAAKARLAQITTEMAARRELRDRSAEAARAQSRENVLKIGPVAEKVAKHMGELSRRQKDAGGWATEKTMGDKEHVLGFGPEGDEDEAGREPAGFTPPAPESAEPNRIGALQDDEPTPPALPAVQPDIAQVTPDTPAARGRRAAPDEEDDDFSDTSWLKG